MKSRCAWVVLIGLVQVGAAAGEPSRIELRDGSVISGEVVGFADGRYVVQSPALGQVTIDQSQIRSPQPTAASAVRCADHRPYERREGFHPVLSGGRAVPVADDREFRRPDP